MIEGVKTMLGVTDPCKPQGRSPFRCCHCDLRYGYDNTEAELPADQVWAEQIKPEQNRHSVSPCQAMYECKCCMKAGVDVPEFSYDLPVRSVTPPNESRRSAPVEELVITWFGPYSRSETSQNKSLSLKTLNVGNNVRLRHPLAMTTYRNAFV